MLTYRVPFSFQTSTLWYKLLLAKQELTIPVYELFNSVKTIFFFYKSSHFIGILESFFALWVMHGQIVSIRKKKKSSATLVDIHLKRENLFPRSFKQLTSLVVIFLERKIVRYLIKLADILYVISTDTQHWNTLNPLNAG